MLTTDDDRRREALDERQALRLLRTATVGRLAFTQGALPAILPVSFALGPGHVLIGFRHDPAIENALRRSVVAVEVDDYDPAARTGWSVTVVGPARVLTERPDPTQSCVAVQLDLVRGRTMSPHPVEATLLLVDPAAGGGTDGVPRR